MALPNVVSLLRIGCVPIVLVLMSCPGVWARRAAALIFLAASISDYLTLNFPNFQPHSQRYQYQTHYQQGWQN
jgi:hypothetical protein